MVTVYRKSHTVDVLRKAYFSTRFWDQRLSSNYIYSNYIYSNYIYPIDPRAQGPYKDCSFYISKLHNFSLQKLFAKRWVNYSKRELCFLPY